MTVLLLPDDPRGLMGLHKYFNTSPTSPPLGGDASGVCAAPAPRTPRLSPRQSTTPAFPGAQLAGCGDSMDGPQRSDHAPVSAAAGDFS